MRRGSRLYALFSWWRLTLGQRRVARLAIKHHGAMDVARLQRAKVLLVPITHDLIAPIWVIEANGVADFVCERVAQIVFPEIAVESDFPAA
jgi:hypothetical protein